MVLDNTPGPKKNLRRATCLSGSYRGIGFQTCRRRFRSLNTLLPHAELERATTKMNFFKRSPFDFAQGAPFGYAQGRKVWGSSFDPTARPIVVPFPKSFAPLNWRDPAAWLPQNAAWLP